MVDAYKLKSLPVSHDHDPDGAQHSVKLKPVRSKRRFRPFAILFRILLVLLVLCLIGAGILYYALSRGAISNAQLKFQVESQLSSALGPEMDVKTTEAKIAFGKGGLIALDVSELRIFRDGKTNLGVVDNITVAVRALPLLRGEVVAQSVNMSGASIALKPHISSFKLGNNTWPGAFDFSSVFRSVGKVIGELASTLDEAGLETIRLSDTKLIGFDQLGWEATDARIVQLELERQAGKKQQILFDLSLEIGDSVLSASGAWQNGQNGGRVFSMVLDGISLKELPTIILDGNKRFEMENSLRVKLSAPFKANGEPKQATLNVEVLDGLAIFDNKEVGHLLGAELNFRYFPEKNQIELEPSPFQFKNTSFQLLGGIKFPVHEALEESNEKPVFQLIANDLVPFGLLDGKSELLGAAEISGWVDAKNKTLRATSLQLKTESGTVEGTGAFMMEDAGAAFQAELNTEKISISSIKQFWPWFLGPDFRKWAGENLSAGKITNSSFKLNFTPGLLGNRERYTEQTLSGDINVSEATMKTVGALPRLTNAVAKVRVAGTTTSISLKSGKLNVGKNGVVRVTGGTMNIGSYAKPRIDASLKVAVAGAANAIVQLGTLKPLGYSKALNLQPHQCSGKIKAIIETNFGLKRIAKKGIDNWKATIDINNGALKNPLFGYKVDNVDVKIRASEGTAKITGTASIDGLPAQLALVEKFGGSKASTREISLTLDDAARKRMGADTGDVIKGPVKVVVKALPDGTQKISADLRAAKLNLTWVGWTKGTGIPGKATFDLSRKKGITTIKNLNVSGKGFSAKGNMKIDKAGLQTASFKRVKLNATDDFDADVSRIKNGYSVKVRARSYDGRALIRSLMQNERKKSAGQAALVLDGQISKLIGFGKQSLRNVGLKLKQRGTRVQQVSFNAVAEGGAPSKFTLVPVEGGSRIKFSIGNAGSVLRFLDVYTKARGGTIDANMVRDNSKVYKGGIIAKNFVLLGEPRLAALLSKPGIPRDLSDGDKIAKALKSIKTDKAKVDKLQAAIEMGNGVLNLSNGRLTGGNASAEFSGRVYDKRNLMKIRGTYLPGKAINRMVSNIPVLGWALGQGKVNGLLGITFKLSGSYRDPKLRVNPLSIITPGIFRKIFR